MNEKFASRLYDLWKAGKVDVPAVGEAYSQAISAVKPPAISIADKKDPLSAGNRGAVEPLWLSLQSYVERVIAPSAENLKGAGTTLTKVADAYARTDNAAADRLQQLIAERSKDPELDNPKN